MYIIIHDIHVSYIVLYIHVYMTCNPLTSCSSHCQGVDVEIVPGVRVEGGLEELLDLEEGVVRRLEAEGERDLGWVALALARHSQACLA